MKSLTGIVRGRMIELTEPHDIPEGVAVQVLVSEAITGPLPGAALAATEGALADDPDWDQIMDEIQRSRQWEGSRRNGAS
jgi:hypothetical protein